MAKLSIDSPTAKTSISNRLIGDEFYCVQSYGKCRQITVLFILFFNSRIEKSREPKVLDRIRFPCSHTHNTQTITRTAPDCLPTSCFFSARASIYERRQPANISVYRLCPISISIFNVWFSANAAPRHNRTVKPRFPFCRRPRFSLYFICRTAVKLALSVHHLCSCGSSFPGYTGFPPAYT